MVAVAAVACQAAGSVPSSVPAGGSTSPDPSETFATPAAIPKGLILFHRLEDDEVEHYFTIRTDGTDERALFTLQGCGCARWSPAGDHVWTMGATGHGTYSFMTMRPDGRDAVVMAPPIRTLNLGPAAPSANGDWIAFDGWDETDPARNGLYLGSPDLRDLRLVMTNPEGTIRNEPFGVTADGSRVLVFAETGRVGGIAHAGKLLAVETKGGASRQLNPVGTVHGWTGVAGGSLSPDGRQVAFAVDNAVFVSDIDGGEATRITDQGAFVSAVSWSPTGDWIVYTRHEEAGSLIALVSPDGNVQTAITSNEGSDEAAGATWSPEGHLHHVERSVDGS